MAKDGKYSVSVTISIDVEVAFVIDAEDEDFAHDKATELCDRVVTSIADVIQKNLLKIKSENKQLDDVLETSLRDSDVGDIEELEAPVTDEEEE